MATKKISTTELDFDAIKTNLKRYLQDQDQFSDYDFDGAGLSLLLDVLAYNTHYNALYTNLAVNEAFLDSASKRASVVSKAKELGYVPRSARSATAKVNAVFTLNNISAPNLYELPRGTLFTSSINGKQYNFVTVDSNVAVKSNGKYSFNNIEIKEGKNLTIRYSVSSISRFIIPNANADISTLRVRVQDTAQASTYSTFVSSTSILDVDGTTPVYFIKEIDNQLYEVEFGNGVIGKALESGNVVVLDYIVTEGSKANGCSSFTYNGAQVADSSVVTSLVQAAIGGQEPEDIDSIKWNAPRAYASQNRCVTLDDYRYLILQNFSNADSVNVWGGESNYPPSYGDVFISIKPTEGTTLSDSEKSYLLNDVIGPRKIVTIHPKLVDPSYINMEMDVTVYYNPNATARTANDIITIVKDTILNYDNDNLNTFGAVFKQSALSRLIDYSEDSIASNIITFKLHRFLPVNYNQVSQYVINLANPIYNSGVPEESIVTTGFYVLGQSKICYIDDLPAENSNTGTLRMFYYEINGVKTVVKNIGTVDYSAGVINLNDIVITDIVGENLDFIIKTQSQDVASVRNQIVNIDPTMLTVNVIVDKPADQ